MEKPATCRVCRSKLATHACKNCGANVCDDCYDRRRGICITCMPRQ